MKKLYLLYILLSMAVLPTFGQGVADYYRSPGHSRQYERLLSRYGGPAIKSRWYVALDGFIRTDRARLDNSFDGLIESNLVAKPGWGGVIGWSYKERWTLEAGYARMPIHTQVSIRRAGSPLTYRYSNDQNAFVLRGKRLLVSTSGRWLRSGFWLTGGAWAVPNRGEQEGEFSVTGYSYRGYREVPDVTRLTSQTHINSQVTTLAEAGIEYNVRLSSKVDAGFSVRRFWGLGNSLSTNVTYSVNQGPVQQAQLQGAGTGMSYGLTMRYTFALQRNLPNVMDLRGKIGR